ncbi:type I-E CRISPR-associated protein Cse2/CasB [Streptomyces lavendulae]|uniref:type I-E CRISPR-associated protein Cse2/CasB n=1 Tax=Streptomyces lavendulae TaxID=1914 RepID=UPI0036C68D76
MTETAPQIPAPAPPPVRGPDGDTTRGKHPGPLRQSVAARILSLQHDYHSDRPWAVQALAQLRRGIGRPANDLPDLWNLLGMEQFYAARPKGRRMDDGEALRAERAAHVAVTLWALHQQSNRAKRMHVPDGASLGTAVRRLMSGTDSDEPIRKRLIRAGTATTYEVLAQRLRELVVLLRAAEIPLDYGLLAEHLDQWQQPGGPTKVRQAWGRSFQAYRLADSPGTDPGGQAVQPATASAPASTTTAPKEQ